MKTVTQKSGRTYYCVNESLNHWKRERFNPNVIFTRKVRRKGFWIRVGIIKTVKMFNIQQLRKVFSKTKYKINILSYQEHIICNDCKKEYPTKPKACECGNKVFVKRYSQTAKITEKKVMKQVGYSFTQIYPPKPVKRKEPEPILFTEYIETKEFKSDVINEIKFQLGSSTSMELDELISEITQIYDSNFNPSELDFPLVVTDIIGSVKEFTVWNDTDWDEDDNEIEKTYIRKTSQKEKELAEQLA